MCCQSLPGALKEEMLPFCFAASWLLRMPTLACAPCRSGECSAERRAARSSTKQHGVGRRRGTGLRKKRQHDVADVQKDPCISTHCAQSRLSYRAQRGMSSTGLRLATATPALAALRPAHEHTRAEHARHARTMRARLASRAHALTWQHTLARARQKLDVMLEALATG